MNWLFTILCVVVLSVIVFQDFKYRQIFWVTLPVLFLIFSAQSFIQNGLRYSLLFFIVNFFFVSFIFVLSVLLIAIIKKRSMKETFQSIIGMGDLFFFLVVCAAFSPFMYLAYCGISALLAIVGYLTYNSFMKNKLVTSPFAGIMALSLIFLIVIRQFNHGFDFYDDEMIANIVRFR